MKVGSIVFATNSGLGILAKDFYDNGIVTDVIVVEHGNYANQDWYGDAHVIKNHRVTPSDREKIFEFVKSMDCLLFFETHFFPEMLEAAKHYNKKVILMPMYECSPFPLMADLYISPSLIDFDYYSYMYSGAKHVFIPVPVNSNLEWEQRDRAKHFVHNAGNESAGDRNGTRAILSSLKYIKSPIELTIRYQINKQNAYSTPEFFVDDSRVSYTTDKVEFADLWKGGDVFLFPESCNGLSLPIQEAYSSGMLVMAGNRYPLNTWLPNLPLIDVQDYAVAERRFSDGNTMQYTVANYDPRTIAHYIDEWYGKDISSYSMLGKKWKQENSWETLKSTYIKTIEELI
jgi:hypothetical protein